MESNLLREVFAAQRFGAGERNVRSLEGAGVRADAERARTRRERIARFLKALAYRLTPPVTTARRTANQGMIVT
ncbi:MAG: hypothetical protein ACYDAR_13700 [Thermomicrobiales bacterium]